jgi:hypothetical protein
MQQDGAPCHLSGSHLISCNGRCCACFMRRGKFPAALGDIEEM